MTDEPPRRPQDRPGPGGFLAERFPHATSPADVAEREPATSPEPQRSVEPPRNPAVGPQWLAPDYRGRATVTDRVTGVLPGTLRRTMEAIGGLY